MLNMVYLLLKTLTSKIPRMECVFAILKDLSSHYICYEANNMSVVQPVMILLFKNAHTTPVCVAFRVYYSEKRP
jgi:hypothetical protein